MKTSMPMRSFPGQEMRSDLAMGQNEVGTIKNSLTDLTENIQRLRSQLREVEIQAEAQIAARAKPRSQEK